MNLGWMTGALGLVVGVRHALEPDHIAAVSSLVTEQRTPKAALVIGALWGLGHSLTLLVVGGTLTLFEAQMPLRLAAGFELLVAAIIVALGLRALARAWREGSSGPALAHRHGDLQHVHPVTADHLHLGSWTLATRPLLVGAAHGLAGSGALTALVLSELPSVGQRLVYLALFAAGSIAGMAFLTGLMGLPLHRLAYHPRTAAALLGIAGLFSVGVGSWWGFESGVRLFGG